MTSPAPATAPAVDQAAPQRTWVEMIMGLPISVTVRGPAARGEHADQVVRGLHAELRHADRVFSTHRTDSEISLLGAGALPRELVSTDVQEVLALCEQARQLTGGLFDVALRQPDGRYALDPSGLVKGWAVERAARALDGLNGHDWIVNAGGDVLGSATHGPAWQVGIEDPRDRSRVLCILPLHRGAIATSGTAARGDHILDPRTGRPAPPRLLSATVTGPSLTWADILATAAYVEGPTAHNSISGLNGYNSLLLLPDGHLHRSARAGQMLSRLPSPISS